MGTAADGGPGAGFGSLLRSYRTAACLTQEEVARRSGLSVRALSDMERGHTAKPLSRSVRLLADALDLDAGQRARLVAAVHGEPDQAGMPAPADRRAGRYAGLVVPRQLPAGVRHFAGRSAELRALTGLLDQVAADGALGVAVISGPAGVGKTALAVHWGHQVANRFPDGQLYVDLRGRDSATGPTAPTEADWLGRDQATGVTALAGAELRGCDRATGPVAPGEAVCGFLGAFGVARDLVPAGLEAQAALYRSLLAGRRVLIVADNARDEHQVRPLLPGAGGNLVVVTSRSRLGGLVAREGARYLGLDALSQAESWQLLAGRLGAARLSAEPRAAAELISRCERLPLRLAEAAARAAVSSDVMLATLVAELGGQDDLAVPVGLAIGGENVIRPGARTTIRSVKDLN
jgi:transcriptional regulator with XRE-family HTH domain